MFYYVSVVCCCGQKSGQKPIENLTKNLAKCLKNHFKNICWGILTCIGEFQPGNKNIYVVFDEESEFLGPRTPKLSLDQVF